MKKDPAVELARIFGCLLVVGVHCWINNFGVAIQSKSGTYIACIFADGKEYTSRTFSDLIQMRLGVHHVLHIVAPLWLLRVVSWVAEHVARLVGTLSTLNMDKYRIMCQRNWRCDITPARNELGYQPKWPLTRGVKATFSPKSRNRRLWFPRTFRTYFCGGNAYSHKHNKINYTIASSHQSETTVVRYQKACCCATTIRL